MKTKIVVQDMEIAISMKKNEKDYICITDIAKYKDSINPRFIIQNWMRNRNTMEFLGTWENLYNKEFNRVEFEAVRKQAGLNSFVMTPTKWIETTNAIGIASKAGRYGGTYAYKDIAFEFASWISVEFKLYLIKEFERLKEQETKNGDWDVKRLLAKVNYGLQTDAIIQNLIPSRVTGKQLGFYYADEADLLNVALFGMTSAEWKKSNPGKQGNMRDYANVAQLVCLLNLESLNSVYIKQGLERMERLRLLNETAISQMSVLVKDKRVQELEDTTDLNL